VHAAGVCGTDLHIWLGEYPSVPPVTMGHEVCGTVSAVGDGVDASWLGARVAVETFFSTCGKCSHCRAGKLSVCEQRQSIGTHVDGGFAPRLVLPARNLHRVPDGLQDEAAALSEPLACVCNSLLDPSRVQVGDDVLVIGPGAIGLIAAQVARACGGRVTVRGAERDRARLELAASLGFPTSAVGADPPAADVVVECSGAGRGIADALRAARRRGRIVQMGLRGADVTVPYDLICFHELTVSAGFASNPLSWRRAMALLEAGSVELAPLVTEVVPLADWRRAFDASRAGEGVKYVLDPR
jgi:L-iditol 2-dehydrogenase